VWPSVPNDHSHARSGEYQNLEAMVTSRIGLDDVVKDGFEQLIHNKDEHVKILVSPKPELLRKP
jgi:threonine dehydrogenase-like Zn-dependent dehydrogenase